MVSNWRLVFPSHALKRLLGVLLMRPGHLVKRHGRLLADVRHACSLLSDANVRITREVSARGGYLLPLDEVVAKVEANSQG